MDVIRLAELRHDPLSVDEVLRAVSHPEAGGVAIFTGVVRNHDRGNEVTRLTYTAHPSAPAELRRVAEKIAAQHDVRGVAAVHRLGRLDIGELAVVVAVASPHRGGAFTACRALIDELKASVPIWKHQELTAGGSEWVNSEWADPGQPGAGAGQPAASAGQPPAQPGASAEEPPARA